MPILRIVVMLFISTTLYSCSSSSSDNDPDDQIAFEGLRIAHVNNGHMINMQTVAEAYTDQTGVPITWVALEEGVLTEQVTSDSAPDGSQYDVINIGMHEVPYWGEQGWLQPLTFSSAHDTDDIFRNIRTGLTYNGGLYASPFYGESSILMYRQDLADAAAVQIFDNDSWANIELAAAAMHNPDENIYGACLRGRPGWGDNMAFVSTIVNSHGGQWFDSDYRPQLDSAEWNTAINFYVDLLNNYGPPNSEQNSFNEILALFNNGQCGMWIDSTIAPTFINTGNVAYVQAPNAGFPNAANWLWSWNFAIPAGTPHTEVAQKFIEWATSKEYIQTVGNHPDFGWGSTLTGTRASSYAIPEFQEAFPAYAAERTAIESAAPDPTALKPYLGIQFAAIPEYPAVGNLVADEIAAALSGTKSVEDALSAAQTGADAIMRAAGYY